MKTFTDLLLNAFPMLLLIAVWIYFMVRLRKGGFNTKYQTEYLALLRANTAAIERIAATLEKNASEPRN